MTAFLLSLSLVLGWATGTGMILLLGWKQDGRVRKGDALMAILFGLLFWWVLLQEVYQLGAENIRRRIS